VLLTLVFILAGFLILGVGAELMVNGSSRLALRLGISPLMVGLTVVAFGTSAPELAVSIESTLSGLSAIALGNVVGSNIANIGLILGVTALIHPIRIERDLIRHQIPVVIACSVLMGLLLLDGEIGRLDGVILCTGLLVYLVRSFSEARSAVAPEELELPPIVAPRSAGGLPLNFVLVVLGLALLVFGSQIFVNNAVELARFLGISEAVIGLSLVAVGTSIPELATSATAALRKQSDLAVGNVVGSNIFNILCVLGITALLGSISGSQFEGLDFAIMLAFALLLLPFAGSGLVLSRLEGTLLLAAYCGYVAFISLRAV